MTHSHKRLDLREEEAHTYLMDTTAHRTIQRARGMIVDTLNLNMIIDQEPNHGLSREQQVRLRLACFELLAVMLDDPSPPNCIECDAEITQPATGRPRQFCGDACRQRAAYYAKTAGQ